MNLENLRVLNSIDFLTSHIVTFDDVDMFGHMNSEKYINYFFKHRWIGIRTSLGITMKEIASWPIYFVVKNVDVNYLGSLFCDDEFSIVSKISTLNNKSCEILCEMKNRKNQNVSTCKITLVCIERQSHRPSEWPIEVIKKFYMKNE